MVLCFFFFVAPVEAAAFFFAGAFFGGALFTEVGFDAVFFEAAVFASAGACAGAGALAAGRDVAGPVTTGDWDWAVANDKNPSEIRGRIPAKIQTAKRRTQSLPSAESWHP
jgi:hypothetical protein